MRKSWELWAAREVPEARMGWPSRGGQGLEPGPWGRSREQVCRSVSTVATLGWWSMEGPVQPSCFCQ